ncbi:DUF1396 domain-containing protein [Streptomyces sp. NPDC060027]|uniref:DUF1396 domain-containing protein n=1 Tax=Streptomyces sp. NPDC060027 TaxID=3347040 RepID=UPI0036CD9F97
MGLSVRNAVRHPATGAALAALVLGGGAVACTKDAATESPALTPAAAVAKAAKKAETITSLRYRMAGKVPEQGRVGAEAVMTMKPLAMSMKMTSEDQAADGPVETRIVGNAMYIGTGAQAAKDMDGKSWIKFDMPAPGVDRELNSNQPPGGGRADKNPATESTFLTGSKNVKKVGTETVDGVKTTHYKGTVTLDEFRASLKGEGRAARATREKSFEQYTDMGIDTLAMDMWVDGDDRIKQFRMRGTADKGPLDMTITFLDYNKPVTVKAPPAKDTADLAEMMKGVQQR